jgi:hypothetical protein
MKSSTASCTKCEEDGVNEFVCVCFLIRPVSCESNLRVRLNEMEMLASMHVTICEFFVQGLENGLYIRI